MRPETSDSQSRGVLAWRVSERFDPKNTVATLIEATRRRAPGDKPPTVLADAGVENVNAQVDEFIGSGALRRLLALTEIAFSNSMIESWWRTLKHQWLYLSTLDTIFVSPEARIVLRRGAQHPPPPLRLSRQDP